METSLFWDAQRTTDGSWDRTYSSDDFAAMWRGFWGDGLIPNRPDALLVEVLENTFSVVVNPGDAMLGGRFYGSTSDLRLTLSQPGDEDRVDLVALRLDKSKRRIWLRVLEGAPGEGEPTRADTDTVRDLILARVHVRAGSTYLTDEDCEDLRGTSLAPWVDLRFDLDNVKNGFQEWYERMRQLLDEDVAVQLSNRIDEVESKASRNIVRKNGIVYLNVAEYDPALDPDVP